MKQIKPSEVNEISFDEIAKAEEWYFNQQLPRVKILFEEFKK